MSDIAILVLPTMYIFAMVTGFMLNTCSKTKMLETLEDENYELERRNSILTAKLQELEPNSDDSE